MRKCISLIFLFILFLASGFLSGAQAAREKEIYVIDGDTFSWNGQIYRLWGIDAPELKQTCWRRPENYICGSAARSYLESVIDPATLDCQTVPRAKKETRIVAKCKVDGEDLGRKMVRAGWALDYTYFSNGAYANEEKSARAQKKGIWAGEFQQPKDWRKAHPR